MCKEKEKFGSCSKNESRESHTCPYKQEINDSDTECNCCSECTRECAMDI